MIRKVTLAASLMLASAAGAVTCEDRGDITLCTVDATTEDLRLFHTGPDGNLLGSFYPIEDAFGELQFAMNAGMYHDDRAPVGLHLENGVETMYLVPNPGPGNFGMLPNGVFCIGDDFVSVIETLAYRDNPPDCNFATQSGPMLVIDGDLHPRFIEGSTSRYIRNGVGVSDDGETAYFAISNRPINFWDFGSFFRDELGVSNALYFDGKVSRLFAPDLGRRDGGPRMGPMVGVIAPE